MILNNKIIGLQIEFEDEIIKEFEKIALKFYPNEIGGYLMGYYTDDKTKAVVVKQILSTNFENSPTSFKHIVDENLKETFVRIFDEEKIHYLGEWHTHPNSNSNYSLTDFKALKKIVENKDSNIENPILLIIGFDKKGIRDYSFNVFFNNKLYKYE
ncbi:Mov34/MPN/PAD-1 family protein [Flavobacterium sp. SORGH_AS_0622]|uniref:Mov34/MPN/PAD-1 family protein n=1 Tax=Flavobacterium sp. SORGH_AS_0622 TaxID=3041772 RepID=UPI0027853840|nr:Mov34/MPN/PAD-1 family protein [Flavobacterium sp. SORGH_AS_0622]MDQ1166888.1 integrative and conjugative element protein (TIGR02256 family) [Flavobacterium sp. SORGH_AS_0622]